jgi:hypothetical protein
VKTKGATQNALHVPRRIQHGIDLNSKLPFFGSKEKKTNKVFFIYFFWVGVWRAGVCVCVRVSREEREDAMMCVCVRVSREEREDAMMCVC